MSEIDPWALPQGGVGTAGAGIPGAAPQPAFAPVAPLNKTLPIVVMALGVLYVLVSLIEVFVINNEISFANSLDVNNITQDQVNQAQSDDNAIATVSVLALIVFLGTLIAIGVWQRSLNRTLGSVGARKAVFNRAGYVYFRATWLVSILLSVFLQATTSNNDLSSIQDAVNHDHELMLYYGLRAIVGVVLIFFAFRLKKISEEGVARLGGRAF
ncbi:hypothetical protein KDK95_24965 [Actinospica sp. MGRD01-02]|uniref:Uncharacterized protein n=1 Tax=Actinospica acidithermotolerans TaxID=2828514 RepID=A0A941EDT4_9ACTN|nr:hypothetical protein [Actinospica acidithermotolerans]MBR7829581.1 hypothetical protein [Actinospica acidithermotolerans]